MHNKANKQIFSEGEVNIEIQQAQHSQQMSAQQHIVTPINDFQDLNLAHKLLDNIELNHYTTPTIVQKYSIPIISNGRDLMSCAQTGSGKTLAYLIPIINQLILINNENHKIQNYEFLKGYNTFKQTQPSALILAPTRELAIQIFDEACKFSTKCGLRPCVVYGGEDIRVQINDLNRNSCDILVATPGRLKDLHDRRKINFCQIKYLVLDEADRMLDMGFEPQIRELVQLSEDMPLPSKRHTLMFSATFPRKIQALASEFLHEYIFLSVGRVGSASKTISQKLEYVREVEKPMYLIDILSSARPETLKLIFVETKYRANQLEALFQSFLVIFLIRKMEVVFFFNL